ncbi:MAG: MBL fold metallo-hydrolase [bacterium]
MKISFHGAAGEVTGSCSLVKTEQEKFLIDCGMFQGGKKTEQQNLEEFSFNPMELDCVIITHAHLDHIGRLPLLIKAGYQGPIYATTATADLAKLILEDALHVMQQNYKHHSDPVLYDSTDVSACLQQFKITDYGSATIIKNKAKFTFHDAGHIFGSAFVEIEAGGKHVIFSGDVGNCDVPILRETENLPNGLDLVVCESTYGGRIHEAKTNQQREEIIEGMIVEALGRGGTLMIPSFALERTQQLLYLLNELIDRKKVLPRVPIFLDSPLAIKATEVYRRFPKYYDQEARKLYQADDDLFNFPGLTFTETVEQSKSINQVPGSKIIIAGAGMMNGGRILHHAMRHLSDNSSTLLFIGYQANGTLGRQILDGVSQVKIMKEKIPVKCKVRAIGALSAHADQSKILDWLGNTKVAPKQVILNHGEIDQSEVVLQRIEHELGIKTKLAEIDRWFKI